ncbi:helix-turn-helix domain-containing protein [Hydrogenophaga sp. ZJX-1]|uniref:helix-turn-helix domain-containing protein n=1 Tax=Hydrogenophaga sp. ZJX-1 TaxID=3404778 RepID=UPI003B27D383
MRITAVNCDKSQTAYANTYGPNELEPVRAFLETAETGSLSAAARKLGWTQPTFSRQVAAIERERRCDPVRARGLGQGAHHHRHGPAGTRPSDGRCYRNPGPGCPWPLTGGGRCGLGVCGPCGRCANRNRAWPSR